MADITNEYAVDPLTGESIAVDPPLQQSDTPLMGNPVLMRRNVPRKGRSNTALYAGAAVAVVAVLAGGAYLAATGMHQRDALLTNAETAPPQQQQAALTPPPTPAPVTVPVPAPALAPIVASAEAPVQPLHAPRFDRAPARAHHAQREDAAAKAATENGADAAATVAPSQMVTQPPPAVAAPPPAPIAPAAAPPVITPPPAS